MNEAEITNKKSVNEIERITKKSIVSMDSLMKALNVAERNLKDLGNKLKVPELPSKSHQIISLYA